MMNSCKSVQSYIPLLATGGLSGSEKHSVEGHLEGCEDCRQSLQKTRKLQSILSLKRSEKPDPFFFQTFLADFHQRLCREAIQKSFWVRVADLFAWESVSLRSVLRFSYGAAAGVALLGLSAVYFMNQNSHSSVGNQVANHSATGPSAIVNVDTHMSQLMLASDSSSGKDAVYVLDRVNYQPSTHASTIIHF